MINFNEIPLANSGEGNQDSFELFARDFLKQSGYKIISEPSRGPDGGIDILLEEQRDGNSGQTTIIRWLVSCKHYSHSGQSITPSIEKNIVDRVKAADCHGFIGFYSTISSTGLNERLQALLISSGISYIVFDSKKIESEILGYTSMELIFMRYFPESYKKWKELYYYNEPSKLFTYYFEKEFEIKGDIFKTILGSPENILKALLNTDSFQAFMEYNSTKYIIEDIPSHIQRLFEGNVELFAGKNPFEILMSVCNDLLPDFLSKKHKIKILPETKVIKGLGENMSVLYSNAYFVTVESSKELETLYGELIDICK